MTISMEEYAAQHSTAKIQEPPKKPKKQRLAERWEEYNFGEVLSSVQESVGELGISVQDAGRAMGEIVQTEEMVARLQRWLDEPVPVPEIVAVPDYVEATIDDTLQGNPNPVPTGIYCVDYEANNGAGVVFASFDQGQTFVQQRETYLQFRQEIWDRGQTLPPMMDISHLVDRNAQNNREETIRNVIGRISLQSPPQPVTVLQSRWHEDDFPSNLISGHSLTPISASWDEPDPIEITEINRDGGGQIVTTRRTLRPRSATGYLSSRGYLFSEESES